LSCLVLSNPPQLSHRCRSMLTHHRKRRSGAKRDIALCIVKRAERLLAERKRHPAKLTSDTYASIDAPPCTCPQHPHEVHSSQPSHSSAMASALGSLVLKRLNPTQLNVVRAVPYSPEVLSPSKRRAPFAPGTPRVRRRGQRTLGQVRIVSSRRPPRPRRSPPIARLAAPNSDTNDFWDDETFRH
jgi:hypothetical protein